MKISARITLVYPSDGLVYKYNRARTKRMPVGLGYIAAATIAAGHKVKIIDASLYDLTIDETVKQILDNNPDIVGIGCTTPLYHQAVQIIHEVKKRAPNIIVVMGGPHVSALPEATLKTSEADFVCIGEGEESFVSIIDAVVNNKDPKDIDGIVYDWNHHIGQGKEYRLRINQDKATTAKAIDLDKVPIPARHVFKYKEYVDYARDYNETQTQAMFSRGCPGKCSFCGAADTLVRFRDLDNILQEMNEISQLGIKNVAITDDTYTSNKKRVLALSRGITDLNLDLNISVQLRLDQIDEEICDAMYESGVSHVGPGIESGNDIIIAQIGKGRRESKENMRKAIRLLQNYDWKIRNSYIMGMPDETEDQVFETIMFAKELGADENAFSIVVPYPDSPLWDVAKSRLAVHDEMDFSKFLYYHEIGCNLSSITTTRLLALHEFAYEYVGNPAYSLNDDSVSSGHRPHIPYLKSDTYKKHREESKMRLDEILLKDTKKLNGNGIKDNVKENHEFSKIKIEFENFYNNFSNEIKYTHDSMDSKGILI